MTEKERAELRILRLANELGKFAVPLHPEAMTRRADQEALERLQVREWVRLIDVSFIAASGGICRLFMLTQPARDFLRRSNSN